MTFNELTDQQKYFLKQSMLCELLDRIGETPSYGELGDVNASILDEEVASYYSGFDFTEDDFGEIE